MTESIEQDTHSLTPGQSSDEESKPKTLDEAVQLFAAYARGENVDFDELDFKEFIIDVYVPSLTFNAVDYRYNGQKAFNGRRIKNGWNAKGEKL